MKLMKKMVKQTLYSFGYSINRLRPESGTISITKPAPIKEEVKTNYSFSGKYTDASGSLPTVCCQPGEPKEYAAKPVMFLVDNGKSVLSQEVAYSSLTLLKMVKHFQFESVLDIGSSSGREARIFAHLGKKVTTCEILPSFAADYKDDILNIRFPQQFDAIWCSHVLEHQRNVGLFLNKIFEDLRDGGVLALTVPFESGSHLSFGHCNHFNPVLLIYHLVIAGFCCKEISLCCYDGNIGIVLRKKYNGIDRMLPQATLPLYEATANLREMLGKEVFEGMAQAFPNGIALKHAGTLLNSPTINWGDPI